MISKIQTLLNNYRHKRNLATINRKHTTNVRFIRSFADNKRNSREWVKAAYLIEELQSINAQIDDILTTTNKRK